MSIDEAVRSCKRALEDALARLGKHLECAVCMSLPNERAVSLPCSHYFCEACCETAMKSAANGKPRCPTCRAGFHRRQVRADERFVAIVRGFQGVCAAAVGGVEAEVPYGSQIPRDVLEANGATKAPRRTSASRVREIREDMMRGNAAFLNALGKEPVMWGDDEDGRRRAETDAAVRGRKRQRTGGEDEDANRVVRRRTTWTGPVIDLKAPIVGEKTCAFCKRGEETGEPLTQFEEEARARGKKNGKKSAAVTKLCHETCAMWAPLTVCNGDGTLTNVCSEVQRASKLRCFVCKKAGAAAGCSEDRCKKSFHIWCARLAQGTTFDAEGFSLTCAAHSETMPPPQPPQPRHRTLGSIDDSDVSYEIIAAESSRRPCLVGSFLSDDEKKAIEKFCEQFDCAFESQLSEETTHLVMGSAKVDANLTLKKKSAKFYDAVVKGCWIVTAKWIRASLKEKRVASEDEFEVLRDARGNEGGPRRGRLNKGTKIFSSWHFVYFGKFRDASVLEKHTQFARVDGGGVTRVETSGECVPSIPLDATVVLVVDETPDKAASKARYVREYLPFARRICADAVVPSEYVADCVSRRETIDFGSASIDELTLRLLEKELESADRHSELDVVSVSTAA